MHGRHRSTMFHVEHGIEDSGYGYVIGQVIYNHLVLNGVTSAVADTIADSIESTMLDGDWLSFRNGVMFSKTFTPSH